MTIILKKYLTIALGFSLLTCLNSFANEVPGDTLEASQTILLWPGTPPGALQGDDTLARTAVAAVKEGTYSILRGNCIETSIPTIEVYQPSGDKQTGTAVVIYSGGGYTRVCIGVEGIPMARWLNEHGITVFMVGYRCSTYRHPVPIWDAQRAVRLVRYHARDFGINPDRIGILGFSAGGHLASTLSVHYNATFGRKSIDEIDRIDARPDFTCLIYPLISMRDEISHSGARKNLIGDKPEDDLVTMLSNAEHIEEDTPPSFLVHARSDDVVSFINSQKYYEACKQLGVPSRYILLSAGGHGPGIQDGKPTIKGSDEDYADDA